MDEDLERELALPTSASGMSTRTFFFFLLIPLEALLLGVGTLKPIRTKDYKHTAAESTFPLARLREWNMMLRGAKLVASCSSAEFQHEIDS